MVPLYRSRACWAAAALLVLGTGCGGGGGDGGGGTIEPPVVSSVQAASSTSQDNQPAGCQVGEPPAVTVRDQRNATMAGVTVTFDVTAGGGTVTPTSVATGADGVARVDSWMLGPSAGVHTATATVGSLPAVVFGATAVRSPTSVHTASAATQLGFAGGDATEPPAVLVFDCGNNPLEGVTVSFAVTAGGGSVSPAEVVTGANGIARLTSWTLGPNPVNNAVSATVATFTPVLFTAVVPAQIQAITPVAQTGAAARAVPQPPGVVVRDQDNVAMAGVLVTFAVTGGGGSIIPAAVLTGADGTARLHEWVLGSTLGDNTVTASVAGLPAVSFAATGVLVPTAIVATSSTEQEALVDRPVASPPAVFVRDQFDQPLQGATVTFAVTAGGGAVTPSTVLTGSDGVASATSWVLGSSPGANTVSATVNGLAPVTFAATALADPCAPVSLTLGVAVNGTLGNSGCRLDDNAEFVEMYRFTIGTQQAVRIAQSSAQFDTYVLLFTAAGNRIAENDDISFPGNINSELFAVLPAGTYLVGASSFDVGETGTFSLLVETASADVTDCKSYFVGLGTDTQQSLSSTDCELAGFRIDRFVVFLAQGQTVTVDMTSAALDAYLLLFDDDGAIIAENNNRDGSTTDARIVYTADRDGYYTIETSSAPGVAQTGAYRLEVR